MSVNLNTGYPSIDKPWLKYYSQESIKEDFPACIVYDYLWQSNREYVHRIAINYFGNKISFGQLFDNIEMVAKAYSGIGVKSGDIVTIASVMTPETVYSFYGLNRIGAISNMVDPRTSVEGINHYLREVHSQVTMCIDVALPKILEAIKGTEVKTVIVVSPADSLRGIKKVLFKMTKKTSVLKDSSGSITWNDFIDKGINCPLEKIEYRKDTCCTIVHTGGTTGTPKGVMLSNDNVNALVWQSIKTEIDMQREHTWLDIMPPFIAYGIGMGMHLPLVIGMETILIPQFDPFKFDELLLKHKPIHMVGVPSYWGTIINSKKLQDKDLSYMIAPTVGGDTMVESLEMSANEFLKKHGCNYPVTKGYGMTEVCAGVAGTVDGNNEIGSVGIPFVKTIISIFDPDTGEELPYGEKGEVCIHSPNMMLGYYENQSATDEVIRKHADGLLWVHSGDIGYMNERGSLFIVDRMKRMIIRYDGFKVFPSAIEKVIGEHPAIKECCVVGTADKDHKQGKLPIAYIVINDGYDLTNVKNELEKICVKELAEYSQPVDFMKIDEMPLTPIGKVNYRELEERINYK